MSKRILLVTVITLLIFSISTAQRPDSPEYGLRGDYGVGTMELTIEDDVRPLDVSIWYPTEAHDETATYPLYLLFNVQGQASRDAQPMASDSPYPVVLFSHGSGGSKVLQLWLTEHLASHGFVVLAPNHTGNDIAATASGEQDFALNYALRPDDMLRVLDLADELNQNGEFSGFLDMDNVASIGHSFGGFTALSTGGANLNFTQLNEWCETNNNSDSVENFLPDGVCFLQGIEPEIAEYRELDDIPDGVWDSTTDDRIKTVIALAPWNAPILDHSGVDIPTLIIVGTDDSVTIPERDAYVSYDALSEIDKWLVTLELGDHYLFVDQCPPALINFGAFDSCSDDVWDMQRAHDISNHIITAFLRGHLLDDDEALALLEEVDFRGVEIVNE